MLDLGEVTHLSQCCWVGLWKSKGDTKHEEDRQVHPNTEAAWLLLCLLMVLTSLKRIRQAQKPAGFTSLVSFALIMYLCVFVFISNFWFCQSNLRTGCLVLSFCVVSPWSGFWIFHPRFYIQYENHDNQNIKILTT